MAKKPLSKKESAYIERVRRLPCSCCGASGPSYAHHPREGQGTSQRAGNFTVISLCYDCHQGPLGVHGDKTFLRIYKVTEMDLLDKTIELLNK